MKPFERILVALDFSAPAQEALRLATDLARRYAARLDLLFVFEPMLHLESDDYRLLTPEHRETTLHAYRSQLAAAKAAALAAGVRAVETAFVQADDARVEIPRFASERESDLIVMGTHGRSGAKRLLLGSVAERIVRTARCPVLTVRGGPAS